MIHTKRASSLRCTLRRFVADTGGATAIEYAIIAAGVGATVAGAIYSLGTTIQETFYDRLSNVIQ
jgi:pilus assembly protein Flp/PilA